MKKLILTIMFIGICSSSFAQESPKELTEYIYSRVSFYRKLPNNFARRIALQFFYELFDTRGD